MEGNTFKCKYEDYNLILIEVPVSPAVALLTANIRLGSYDLICWGFFSVITSVKHGCCKIIKCEPV